MQEEWLDIEGYEGSYQVSNLGQVRNKEGRILKQQIDIGKGSKSYRINLRQKMCFVHRLVAKAFIPNPENKPCVDHIDQNSLNNTVSNLRWATHSENHANVKKSISTKISYTSSYKGVSKTRTKQIKWRSQIRILGKITHLQIFYCMHAAARKYNQTASEVYGEYCRLNEVQECDCDECLALKT